MIQGLKSSTTAITAFADDDVFWLPTFLTYILATFEDPKVGAAGGYTCPSRDSEPNIWEFLGAAYLERWNFEIAATSNLDGGIACLSGRTAVFRTKIIQDEAFLDELANEKWLGGVSLSSADDDNFMTRWLVNHGWKIKIQCAPEAALTTALEIDSAFLGQCIRWCRTTWRSNITSLFVERTIWRWVEYSAFQPLIVLTLSASNRGLHMRSISQRSILPRWSWTVSWYTFCIAQLLPHRLKLRLQLLRLPWLFFACGSSSPKLSSSSLISTATHRTLSSSLLRFYSDISTPSSNSIASWPWTR